MTTDPTDGTEPTPAPSDTTSEVSGAQDGAQCLRPGHRVQVTEGVHRGHTGDILSFDFSTGAPASWRALVKLHRPPIAQAVLVPTRHLVHSCPSDGACTMASGHPFPDDEDQEATQAETTGTPTDRLAVGHRVTITGGRNTGRHGTVTEAGACLVAVHIDGTDPQSWRPWRDIRDLEPETPDVDEAAGNDAGRQMAAAQSLDQARTLTRIAARAVRDRDAADRLLAEAEAHHTQQWAESAAAWKESLAEVERERDEALAKATRQHAQLLAHRCRPWGEAAQPAPKVDASTPWDVTDPWGDSARIGLSAPSPDMPTKAAVLFAAGGGVWLEAADLRSLAAWCTTRADEVEESEWHTTGEVHG